MDVALKVDGKTVPDFSEAVSILVLLDVALKASWTYTDLRDNGVSILVLLDVALKAVSQHWSLIPGYPFQSLFSWMLL